MFNTYRFSFLLALGLHLLILIFLVTENSKKRPVLVAEKSHNPGIEIQAETHSQNEIVKAVSIDNNAVNETINRLKSERENKRLLEVKRQQDLVHKAEFAKQQRVKEQQQLARLKEEANKIAIERKKLAEEEKKRLKELAEEKIKEAKKIAELKKQKENLLKEQQAEAKKIKDLHIKKLEENARAEEKKELAAKKYLAEKERKSQEAIAAKNAEQKARIAGEVDKYKALIVNAIGRNWILPENVDSNLSSQFRIRLAPNGVVLEVTLTRSSGDSLLDRSAQNAIYKASPLPVPNTAEAFNVFRDISLTVRPEQVRG